MTLSLTSDFAFFDNQELIEYVRMTIDGEQSSTMNVPALRRAPQALVMPGEVQHLGPQVVWHIKATSLAFTPARGDKIISDTSGTWEVMTVRTETLGARYKLQCVKK